MRGSARSRRKGATLIEVLAGLVVLGTVLSAVVIARGRFLRQWAVAEQRIDAIRAADSLVAGWMSGSATPVRSEGVVNGYIWRTEPVMDRNAQKAGAVVVRVELYRKETARPVLAMEVLANPVPATQPAGRER